MMDGWLGGWVVSIRPAKTHRMERKKAGGKWKIMSNELSACMKKVTMTKWGRNKKIEAQ
jgi:hypothetical protein